MCQSVLSWVFERNIFRNPRSLIGIICKFYVGKHEVCGRNANLARHLSFSKLYRARNASMICSRNLIVFVFFIWFSQVFAYDPVTVFSNAWVSSNGRSAWVIFGKAKYTRINGCSGMAHTTKQGSTLMWCLVAKQAHNSKLRAVLHTSQDTAVLTNLEVCSWMEDLSQMLSDQELSTWLRAGYGHVTFRGNWECPMAV